MFNRSTIHHPRHHPRHHASSLFSPVCWLVAALLFSSGMVWGQAQRTQEFDLVKGWNAIYLDVDPDEAEPSDLFANLPIDMVATYVPSEKGAQFVENPSAELLSAYGWAVWYAPHRSDAILSSLFAIYGGKPYLVHATSNANWSVEGTYTKAVTRWIPDAYNFVGYSVQTPGGPTFKQFFEASPAHNHNKIYRLEAGIWQQVLDPDRTLMRSGEAFWIHTDGHSSYPGPLQVDTDSHLGLVVSSTSGADLVLRNRSNYPLSLSLEHQVASADDTVPLTVPIRIFDEADKVVRTVRLDLGEGNWTQDLPTLEPGAGIRLPFNLRLKDMSPGVRYSLLTVKTDLGTVSPIAVTASRVDTP